jgi:hypothetical protein
MSEKSTHLSAKFLMRRGGTSIITQGEEKRKFYRFPEDNPVI